MVRAAHEDDGEDALVDRARCGDRAAFGELFRAHHARVFRLARARLPHDLAEDAAAETFARAWKALPRYRSTGVPFVGWLYGIARHVVADLAKLQWRTEPTADPTDRAYDPWDGREDLQVLAEAVRALPEEQRAVIELKFLAGLTNDEVAAVLGKAAGAVNTQQWRALRALQRILVTR